MVQLERNNDVKKTLAMNDTSKIRKFSYEKLRSCPFDGAANFGGSIKSVRG